mmetsp:Transcript_64959/g.194214  ORF Transcript_64959/g.194214 Transcript_64959/m.194214 type:complete len:231 (+) Transcript_64959:363-1055(+)
MVVSRVPEVLSADPSWSVSASPPSTSVPASFKSLSESARPFLPFLNHFQNWSFLSAALSDFFIFFFFDTRPRSFGGSPLAARFASFSTRFASLRARLLIFFSSFACFLAAFFFFFSFFFCAFFSLRLRFCSLVFLIPRKSSTRLTAPLKPFFFFFSFLPARFFSCACDILSSSALSSSWIVSAFSSVSSSSSAAPWKRFFVLPLTMILPRNSQGDGILPSVWPSAESSGG